MPPETVPSTETAGSTSRVEGAGSDELALVEAVLRKDRKATAEFVARYTDSVYRYLCRRLAPRTDLVDDLVQDVFLVALQRLHTFGKQSPVAAWMLGIARHKVEDVYRSRLRKPEALLPTDDELVQPIEQPDFESVIDRARLQEETRRVLTALPEPYRTVLLWRYWEKRSTKEMAAETGKTEKSIERLLARARMHFRRQWETRP